MKIKPLSLFLSLLLGLAATDLCAFGRNRVVTDDFPWRVIRTAHFDLYVIPSSEPLAADAARWAEAAYERLTRRLDVVPAGRTSLFLFPTHNRFEQNNIAEAGEGTGGVTEAFKNRIIVFNSGSQFWLEHVITHEFTHVLQFEALYGGFWKSARLLKSPLYPLWAMEGMAEAGIDGMDRSEEDLYLRDAALDKALYSLTELHGFNHLKPHQVTLGYKAGASFIRFLSREYGEDVPGKLLKGMRERFDAAGVASDLTRQDFRSLDARWREYLTDQYRSQAARLKLREPEAYGARLTAPDPLPAFNEKPVLSADGRRVAYLTDREGPSEIAVTDLDTGVTRRVAGRQWGQIEHIHADGRALSFSPDGRWLAFTGEKEQRDFLYLYDTRRGRLRRVRTPFEQVRSPAFHPSGDRLALVGMKDGTNDLYEVTRRGRVLRRLTNSPADEDEPVYSPDGRRVAFSVEVPGKEKYERDLAFVDTESLAMRRLTDMPGDETSPAWTPDGASLLFTGDALEGVHNLYRLDLPSGEARLLTRVIGGNFSPSLSSDGARMAFSSFRHNSHGVYLAGPALWKGGEPAFSGQPSRLVSASVPAAPPADFSPLFAGPPAPYRFTGSTDLFFPLLYYSSEDGFFIATLWQISDQLGNHGLQSSVQYGSGEDFLDYTVRYTYRRFRPQFFIGAAGETFYRDFEKIQQRREWTRFAGAAYPLDRFQRVEGAVSVTHWEERFQGALSFLGSVERENVLDVSYVRDTSLGRWLAVTDGTRFRLTQSAARKVAGGTRDFDATQAEIHHFVPTGGESALAMRGIAGFSTGPTPRLFRIGGGDRVRGYSRNAVENQASRYVMGNLEWRVPLKYMGGAGVSLLPEVAFKALFGTLFVDAGYDGTPGDRQTLGARRPRASVGAGLRVPSFILQTYPVILSMDVAHRTDNGAWSWYLSLGPKF